MIRNIFIINALLTALPLCAQHYHDAILEEVTIPVKEIAFQSEGLPCVSYGPDGQEIKSYEPKTNKQYDEQGYLTTYNSDNDGILWTVQLTYDSQHRLKAKTKSFEGGRVVILQHYDKAGNIDKMDITMSTNTGITRKYSYKYSYILFDDHGNWLTRIRKSLHNAVVEKRIIRY